LIAPFVFHHSSVLPAYVFIVRMNVFFCKRAENFFAPFRDDCHRRHKRPKNP
jgi:hypothetical protein